MLTIKKLSAGYGGPLIITDVNLTVGEKQIVTIIGPNGAGKSTILKSILGFTEIDSESSIHYFNQDLRALSTRERSARGICYVPQGRSLFSNLTVEENLLMGAYLRTNRNEITEALEYVYGEFPRLHQRRHQKAKLMSGGEQQMLALGRALMLKPELLLLDEPSIGLAPKIVAQVFEKIQKIRERGTAILMVEQNAHMALKISDYCYVFELGKKKFEGPASEILNDERIAEAYLGKRANLKNSGLIQKLDKN